MEADVEILKAVKSSGVEPALDLIGVFGDIVADEAAGGSRVVGENLGDDGEAFEIVKAEAVGGVEVERR